MPTCIDCVALARSGTLAAPIVDQLAADECYELDEADNDLEERLLEQGDMPYAGALESPISDRLG